MTAAVVVLAVIVGALGVGYLVGKRCEDGSFFKRVAGEHCSLMIQDTGKEDPKEAP